MNEALAPEQRAKNRASLSLLGYPGWENNLANNRKLPQDYMQPAMAGISCARPMHMMCVRPCSAASNPLLSLPVLKRIHAALKLLALYRARILHDSFSRVGRLRLPGL